MQPDLGSKWPRGESYDSIFEGGGVGLLVANGKRLQSIQEIRRDLVEAQWKRL